VQSGSLKPTWALLGKKNKKPKNKNTQKKKKRKEKKKSIIYIK
jgi:hypothetical protein